MIQSCKMLRDSAIGSQSHLVSIGKFAKVGHEFGKELTSGRTAWLAMLPRGLG